MVNIVPHASTECHFLKKPDVVFSFVFYTAWCFKPDKSTTPTAVVLFTLLLTEFRLWPKAPRCIFIWGEESRDWLCLFLDCCLSVSSTTIRDSTLVKTFDLSKWVFNPGQSYCGALVAVLANDAHLWTQRHTTPILHWKLFAGTGERNFEC